MSPARVVLAGLLLAPCALAWGADPRLVIQSGHANMVTALAIEPQGRWMASGGEDGAIGIWDLRSGFRVNTLTGPATALVALRFDTRHNGLKLTSMGAGSVEALTWDVAKAATGKPLVQDLDWLRQTSSLDGSMAGAGPATFGASGVDGFEIWQPGSARQPWRHRQVGSLVEAIAVGSDGRTVASTDSAGTLTLWTRRGSRYRPQTLDRAPGLRTMLFNRQGQLLVTTTPVLSRQGRLRLDLWDATRAAKVSSTIINSACQLTPLAISDAGHVAVIIGSSTIFLRGSTRSSVDPAPACSAARLGLIDPTQPGQLISTAIAADGLTVAAFDQAGAVLGLGYATGRVGMVSLPATLGAATSLDLKLLAAGDLQPIAGLALLDAGKALAIASDKRITTWDRKTGHPKYTVHTGEEVTALAGNATLDRFAVGDAKGTVSIHAGATGASLYRHAFGGDDLSLAMSGDGKRLAVGRGSVFLAPAPITPLSVVTFADPGDLSEHQVQHFPHLSQGVLSLAYSNDGATLASGHWPQEKGTQRPTTLKLLDSATGHERRTLFAPTQAPVRALAFQPQGTLLAVGAPLPLFGPKSHFLLWDSTSDHLRHTEPDDEMHNGLAFSPDGKLVALSSVMTNGPALSLWQAERGTRQSELTGHGAAVTALAFNGNAQLLSGAKDGTLRLWPVTGGSAEQPEATLVNFRTGDDWLIAAASGQFDTNNLDRLDGVAWVFPDDPLRAFPAEIFTRVLYSPGLFGRLLTCAGAPACNGRTGAPQRMDALNRVQPQVALTAVRPGAAPGEVLVEVAVRGHTDLTQRNSKVKTDAYDLRLFRDGKLVGQFPPPARGAAAPADAPAWRRAHLVRSQAHTFPVQLARGEPATPVLFTAYAFNEDRVKSATARLSHQPAPTPLAPRARKAYVISIGVNAYDDPALNLDYAVNDARGISAVLARVEGYEVVRLQLLSDHARPGVAALRQATKDNFRSILALLAGAPGADRTRLRTVPGIDRSALDKIAKATPDDLVVIAFSGHGYADPAGQFHLLPTDSGQAGAPAAFASSRLISSADLSDWLRPVDAGQMALIIDACHAGASVATPEFRPGPLGDAGFGQLAYDKGMLILAASQASELALEVGALRQGLLTYALVSSAVTANGMPPKRSADLDGNGELTLREWLRYGVRQVPLLYSQIRTNSLPIVVRDPLVDQQHWRASLAAGGQTPALFDFQKSGGDSLLLPALP